MCLQGKYILLSLSHLSLLEAGVMRLQRDGLDLQLLGLPLLLLLPLPLLLLFLLFLFLALSILRAALVLFAALGLVLLLLLGGWLAVLDLQAGDDGLAVFGLLSVVPLDEAGTEQLGEQVVHVHVGRLRRRSSSLGVVFSRRLGYRVVPGLYEIEMDEFLV